MTLKSSASPDLNRSPTDDHLVRAALRGDEDAATLLFDRHVRFLYAFVSARMRGDRSLVEDVVQEVFLAAFQRLDRFETGRSLSAWLVGIARRRLSRVLRRKTAVPETDVAHDLLAWLQGGGSVPDLLEAQETKLAVTGALAGLPDGMRELLLQKYRDERSLAEIGEELGIRADAVSSRLQRARAALRRELEQRGEHGGRATK